MLSNASCYDVLYLAYKDEQLCWPFILVAICLFVVATVGIFFNFSVVFVTFRSKTMRHTANYLLAMTSCFEVLHQSGHFLFICRTFTGFNFINLQTAVRFSLLSLFGLYGVPCLMLFTGIDRFLCVTAPAIYKTKRRGLYLSLIALFLSSAYSSAMVLKQFLVTEQMPELNITGILGDLMQGEWVYWYIHISLTLHATTIVLYLVTGVLIRAQHSKNHTACTMGQQVSRRVFRSLMVVISINMGGYLLMFSYYMAIYPHMPTGNVAVWFVEQFFAILLNISAGSLAPVLFMISPVYRRAFCTEIGRIRSFCRRQSTSIEPNHVINGSKVLAKNAWSIN